MIGIRCWRCLVGPPSLCLWGSGTPTQPWLLPEAAPGEQPEDEEGEEEEDADGDDGGHNDGGHGLGGVGWVCKCSRCGAIRVGRLIRAAREVDRDFSRKHESFQNHKSTVS